MRRIAPLLPGLFVVCLGAMLAPLDTSVNVAFPVITRAFDLPLRSIQWVVIAYVLVQLSLTIAFGRIGDLYGHKRVFTIGLAACVVTHLATGFAGSFGWLVAWRVLQGISVALAVACAPALATLMFPPEYKRRVLAVYVMSVSLGMTVGPLAGGWLIGWLGWPGVYWFRAPLALLALLMLHRVPDVRSGDGSTPAGAGTPAAAVTPGGLAGFDWAGTVLLSVTVACLVLFMAELTGSAVSAWRLPMLLAGFVLAGGLFIRCEMRAAQPVLKLAPFRQPVFAAVQGLSVLISFATFSILLLIPYVMAGWSGMSIVAAGARLSLFPAGSVLGGWLAGRFGRGVAAARLVSAGLLVSGAGLALTAQAVLAASPWGLGVALLVCGLGLGIFQVGYMDATTSLLPAQDRGVAGSLVSVTRLLGIMLGASGIGWLQQALGSFAAPFGWLAGLLLLAGAGHLAWSARQPVRASGTGER